MNAPLKAPMFTCSRTPDGTLSMCLEGKVVVVPSDHFNYQAILAACRAEPVDQLLIGRLMAFDTALEAYSAGELTYDADGVVRWRGKPIDGKIAESVREHIRNARPFKHLARFMELLHRNPSARATREIGGFIARHSLVTAADGSTVAHPDTGAVTDISGWLLGYKRLRPDLKDVHSGTVDNRVGVENRMERNLVDDDWGVACSQGFHVGSQCYVRNYGNRPGYPIAIVAVNPADIVTVPPEETNKLRCAAYTPVSIHDGFYLKPDAVYRVEGQDLVSVDDGLEARGGARAPGTVYLALEPLDDEGEPADEATEYVDVTRWLAAARPELLLECALHGWEDIDAKVYGLHQDLQHHVARFLPLYEDVRDVCDRVRVGAEDPEAFEAWLAENRPSVWNRIKLARGV